MSPLITESTGARGRDTERGLVRDFANAISFESPTMPPLSRRLTFESSRRTVSPPTSVKAFANARRRGQDADTPDPKASRRQVGDLSGEPEGVDSSKQSGDRLQSGHGKPRDAESPLEDFPATVFVVDSNKRVNSKDRLVIDFEFLETLLDGEDCDGLSNADFNNLPDSSIPAGAPMFSSDGDYISMPSPPASVVDEKDTAMHGQHRTVNQGEQSRFNFFSSALESTIHAAEFRDLTLPGENIRSLFELPEGESDGVWWLNTNNPTGLEVWTICKAFGIHPLTIEDIIHKESREKIELFPTYYFACFRSFIAVEEDGETEYHPFNVYVVVFREGIISFSFTPNLHSSKVRFRISQLKEQVSLSSDWICYALIDDIVDSFGPAINQIEHEADAIEDQVFITRVEDNQVFLRKIGCTRKNVMSLMRLLGGKTDVLRAFTKRCTEDYEVTPHMDIALYLGDIQDHTVTMMNSLVHFDTMLSRSHSNYLAQLSIDNISMGNQTNESLSRVTVIATVIVPLNIVCGLFGMNVMVPWRDENSLVPFFGILGALVVFAFLSLVLARRFRYL
ncbi:cora-like Mg2+ transporter [Colletotrichum sublineola]|uniref:Putative CorA-like Mg2+ transporter n=1 Tax=Colletotrichum sublineola TaxID=1173701 RepID=A0A066XPT0_COLSU|nr:cora-like Mg2+ transporter [Colletotrichum sublineola]KDN70902.1 putative CorA-like Mg2+ transporter [Colletotrichum sublineola]